MKTRLRRLAPLLLLPSSLALAAPDDHVHSPEVEKGEMAIEYKGGTYRLPEGGRHSGGTIGFEVGVTDWWATVLMLGHEQLPGDRQKFTGAISENIFQFAKPGSWIVDMGWLVEVGIPRESGRGWTLSTGPLLMKEAAGFTFNANVFYERAYDAKELTPEERKAEIVYQAQVLRKFAEHAEVGVQAFGVLGPWDKFLPASKQSHRVGPTVQGEIALGGSHKLHVDVGYLWGVNKSSPDNGLRLLVSYPL